MTMLQADQNSNDLSSDYLAYTKENEEERAFQEMRQRVSERKRAVTVPDQAQPATPAASAAPAASPLAMATTGAAEQAKPGYALQSPQVDPSYGLDTMVGIPGTATAETVDESWTGKVKAVGKDISKGLFAESPSAIASGVVGGVNEALQTMYDVGDWLRKNDIGPDGYLKVGLDGVSWEKGSVPKDLQPQVENFKAPESTTGKLLKDISQFMTGFVAAGGAGGGVLKATTGLGKLASGAVKGAVSDFAFMDDQQKRLSGILKDTPLENDFTDWIAEGADSPAGNRVKNMVEGLGLGMAAEGAFKMMKSVRDYAKLRTDTAARIAEPAPRMTASREDFDVMGSLSEPLIFKKKVSGVADDVPLTAEEKIQAAEKGLDEAAFKRSRSLGEEEEIFVNYARIDTPEDVRSVIETMVQNGSDDIRNAQRGKQTFTDIKANADQIDAWDTVMSRRSGGTFNAEESVAARNLWISSGSNLHKVAKVAADNPSEANLFAFRKMASVHHAIQQEILGARTEAARTLRSWAIPVDADGEMLSKVLADTLDVRGGTRASRDMAARIASIGDAGLYKEMEAVVSKMNKATSWEMFQEAWINGMLTAPSTHAVNIISNASILGLRIGEKRVAAHIAHAAGRDASVELGESVAMYTGITGGLKDAFRYAWKMAKTGESNYGFQKFELDHPAAITSESMNLDRNSYLGTVVDGLGTLIRSPSRALGVSDEFFKTLAYRMELHSQAYRQAVQDVDRAVISQDQLKDRMAAIIADPPSNIKLASADFAQYATFTNQPGKLGANVQGIANIGPMRLILPFVRTPANILSYSMERTPLGPLMGRYKGEVQQGGERARLAQAQVALGTAFMLVSADMAMSGTITGKGPANPAERAEFFRSGKKPFAIKIGDRYYQYNRFDPFGMQMGIAAAVSEICAASDDDEVFKTAEKAMIGAVLAIGNNVLEKSYMQSMASMVRAISEPDRYGESWAQGLAGSMVPAVVARSSRAIDPYLREVSGMMEAIQSRIPGLSADLPPRRDLWGRPVSVASGIGWAYDFMSPVAASQYKPEPIDKEMERLEYYTPMPAKKVGFSGGNETATIDLREYPGAYSRYVELAGNGVTDTVYRKGCMDYLNDVVSGKSPDSAFYKLKSDGPDGGKADFIKDTMQRYNNLAKKQLLTEFPEIRARANIAIEKKRGLKMPSQEF